MLPFRSKVLNACLVLLSVVLAIELLAGYALFQVSWREKTATSFFFRKIFQQEERESLFEGRLDTPVFKELSSFDKNPFLSFHQLGGYRYHPFIDFSGVHGMYPKEIKLDYFGFRNDTDLYFSMPNCTLVVLTGGSEAAGYSHRVPVSKKLERLLNQASKQKFCVLNLSMNSYSLSNEITAYLHLAFHLKPKVVITHSGANDIGYGAWTPVPFKKLGLAYLKQLEYWLPRLYNLSPGFDYQLERTQAGNEYLVPSYLKNLSKFSKVVTSNGGTLLVGIQGIRDPDPSFSKLMEVLNQEAKLRQFITFQSNPKIQFIDEVHTTEESGHEIASVYAKEILKRIESFN